MYKIGEFSKISNLPVKTLRYYDQEEILVPDFRDKSGYRYYSEANFKQAQIIFMLRELEFSISEMKEVMAHCEDIKDLDYYLEDKKEQINQQILHQQQLIHKINDYVVRQHKKEERINMYQVTQSELQDVYVIGKRFKGSVANSGNVIPSLYKTAKMKVNGNMFTLYYEMEDKEAADLEICVPVKDYIVSEHECHLIKGAEVLMTTHTGSYETLNLAYKAVIDFAKEHDIELGLPIRETCIKGPGMIFKGNPNKYVTEIAIPIIK